jgi:ribonucleoside-triphosphate reductase
MKPDDARSMCCRLRLDQRELRKRGGGLFGSNPLTGSIGVVTINMARIGYLAKTEEEFFERLANLMDVSKESLEIKRKALEDFTEQNLYPYSKFYLRNMKSSTGLHWKNHFSTIGILGMNEALLNFMQKDIASEEGRKFAIKTLDFMRKKISEYQQETGNIYNLEATPGEGTTYRFAKKDKEVYPDIIVANEKAYRERKAAPFYTNSTQLPVGHTDDIFEALMLQDEIQTKYNGGTVIHCFLGEKISSVETTKALVRKIAENFKIPYFTLTPTFSICPKHGYLVGEHEYCPKCDEEIGYKEVK